MSSVSGLAVTIAIVAFAALYGPPQINDTFRDLYYMAYEQVLPCNRPKTYTFGTFDERFGMSQDDFESAVTQAESLWEAALERDLFVPVDADGALTVNLTYDYRQAATDELKRLGILLDDDQATYDRLQERLKTLDVAYLARKADYDVAIFALDERKAEYDREIAHWNDRSGAPPKRYEQLEGEREWLNEEVRRVNALGTALNADVEEINSTVTVINRLASRLNLAAADYNGVVETRGEEFEEGLFTGNDAGGTIDIFEFDGRDRLVRVLTHEFGHALGLEHLDDPTAIMYRLNNGTAALLSDADVTALKGRCGTL